MVSELFIVRWPQNISAVYVRGATIRYSKNQSVYYANEVLSPGQVICTWNSESDYVLSGSAPSLPLLQVGRHYELSFKLKADNDLPVQIQIKFLDTQKEIINSYSSTETCFNFEVPKGTVSYEINLINLKHRWLLFDFLSISESGEEKIIEKHFRKHYDWVHVKQAKLPQNKAAHLIVNRGPRSIVPVSLKQNIDYEQIFVYTDGKNIEKLITDLDTAFQVHNDYELTIEAGIEFYSIPKEIIKKIEMSLISKKITRRQTKNDQLDY